MYKIKLFLRIVIFTFMLSGYTLAHVILTYPSGGETFDGNQVVTIQWQVVVYHGAADWDLFFSGDGGNTWEPIALDLPEAQLDYVWTVPNIATGSGKVKVVQNNQSDQDYISFSNNFTIIATTGINEPVDQVNNIFLYAAYPNPFNPATTISYKLNKSTKVEIGIYNMLGQKIKTLRNSEQSSGTYALQWNGTDDFGSAVAGGVYIYRLVTGNDVLQNKVIFLK